VAVSFVDLRKRPIARAELRRFVDRLGAGAVIDTASRVYRETGLAYLRMTDDEIVERVMADARLLRLPLVRSGNDVSVGRDEAAWTSWMRPS
jgi:arsenate reductase